MSDFTLSDYKTALEYLKIGNAAVHRAQTENRAKGIPNWYSINGFIVSDQEIELIAKNRKEKEKK